MVKITDVARRAGASPSTVSYALSGKRPISDETRRRVEEAAHDLGHRPRPGRRKAACPGPGGPAPPRLAERASPSRRTA